MLTARELRLEKKQCTALISSVILSRIKYIGYIIHLNADDEGVCNLCIIVNQ